MDKNSLTLVNKMNTLTSVNKMNRVFSRGWNKQVYLSEQNKLTLLFVVYLLSCSLVGLVIHLVVDLLAHLFTSFYFIHL